MNNLLKQTQKFIGRNSSTILTTVGGVGVVATTVMAVKATPKAMELIARAEEQKGEKLTKTEVVVTAAPAYVPTIITGVTTLACIFGANVLNKRQQASMAGAYALLDNSYKEYRKKVKEVHGEEVADQIVDEIAKDHYEDSRIRVSEGNQLFYDEFLGEYFESTVEDVLKAQYDINRDLQMGDAVSLMEYYNNLDIDYDDGGMLGWSSGGNFARYWQEWIDFGRRKVTLDDGLECTIITIWQEPYMEFEEFC